MSFKNDLISNRYIILTFGYSSLKIIHVLMLWSYYLKLADKKAITLHKCSNIFQHVEWMLYSCFSIFYDYRCGHYRPLRTLHWDTFCPYFLICRQKCPIFWLEVWDRCLSPQSNCRLLQCIYSRIRLTFASVADTTQIFVEKSTWNWKGWKIIKACQLVLIIVFFLWYVF